MGLRLARVLERRTWMVLWAMLAPWLLLSLTWLVEPVYLAVAWLLPLAWAGLGLWPLTSSQPVGLHRARWATDRDLRALLVRRDHVTGLPPSQALLLGCTARTG